MKTDPATDNPFKSGMAAWELASALPAGLDPELMGVNPSLSRPISRAANLGRCPNCDSIVYSRRHKLCGVCGSPLPDELLFKPAEALRVQSILHTDRRKHREWVAKAFAASVAIL
jgi:hypothetical protein